ncbi:MAG: PIN domain-containing protein [Candidatus Dormibacteria bacterium]
MKAFLDTNILVRHFTGDPPELAARATRYLAESTELLWPDLIVAETIYVLESFYEVERAQVASMIRAALAFPAIEVVDEELLLRAVEVFEVDRIDFSEAYLVANAESSDISSIASFDRSIDRVKTVQRIEPTQI